MDPRSGQHIVREGKKNEYSRKWVQWQAKESQVIRTLQIDDTGHNLEEKYHVFQTVGMDIVVMLWAQVNTTPAALAPTAIEQEAETIIYGTATCLAGVPSTVVVGFARDNMSDYRTPRKMVGIPPIFTSAMVR